MLKFKPFIVLAGILFAVTLLIPTMLVLPFMEEKAGGKLGEELQNEAKDAAAVPTADSTIEVSVYRTSLSKIEKLPLDEYLIGVVAAEMPAEFELEALKAQALSARTYYVRQMMNPNKVGVPEGAQLIDTEIHQVFKNKVELKKQWGVDYKWKMKKIAEAVKETDGLVLTYEGAPIDATFFSTSNGFTENSEEYWANAFPYLRSVESPWDLKSPKYSDKKVIPISEFESKLGVKLPDSSTVGKVINRTAGNRVGKIDIGGKILTGREVRDKLGLRSSDFSWVLQGDSIIISTKGFGHGVGMSQYGANGMATEGKNYKDIVHHYYQGVQITEADSMLTKVTAQK